MHLIFGFLFTVLIYAVIGLVAGFIGTLLNIWSMLLILGSLLFFLILSKSGKIIGKYIVTSFKKEQIYIVEELEILSVAVKNTIKYILFSGVFFALTFVIISLGHIGNPEMLGPSIAVSITSLIYSIAISCFVFFPVQAWAENKIFLLKKEV